ncbi:hypothetical protein HG530_006611 [Fusarium avenaceum]|nr:hypothetical protein HG530_006611 [Fusarium avenaceum]
MPDTRTAPSVYLSTFARYICVENNTVGSFDEPFLGHLVGDLVNLVFLPLKRLQLNAEDIRAGRHGHADVREPFTMENKRIIVFPEPPVRVANSERHSAGCKIRRAQDCGKIPFVELVHLRKNPQALNLNIFLAQLFSDTLEGLHQASTGRHSHSSWWGAVTR